MKLPSWGWALLAVIALFVAYKRGLLGGFGVVAPQALPPAQKDPSPPPATGIDAAALINNIVSGIFSVARNLTQPDTTPNTL